MAAIVIRESAKAAWLTGIVGVRAKAREMVRRVLDCAAAAVLACAVGAALFQLVAELVSFPAPIAVTAITVMAAVLLNSLRRHIRTQPGHCEPCQFARRADPRGTIRLRQHQGELVLDLPRATEAVVPQRPNP